MKYIAARLLQALCIGIVAAIVIVASALATHSMIDLRHLRTALIGSCAVYPAFSPQPDITAAELAYICSHGGCSARVCFRAEQFATLPPGIKRHFSEAPKS